MDGSSAFNNSSARHVFSRRVGEQVRKPFMADKIPDVDLQAALDARVKRVIKDHEKERFKLRAVYCTFFVAGALVGIAFTVLTLGSQTLR
jgi:hypothetical protein